MRRYLDADIEHNTLNMPKETFLKLRKNQATSFNEVFGDFKNKTAGNIVAVSLVKFLTCMLWTLLGIIPGIIKIFQYFAVEYILALRPDITASEALDLSKKLMKGNKLKAFVFAPEINSALTSHYIKRGRVCICHCAVIGDNADCAKVALDGISRFG